VDPIYSTNSTEIRISGCFHYSLKEIHIHVYKTTLVTNSQGADQGMFKGDYTFNSGFHKGFRYNFVVFKGFHFQNALFLPYFEKK
jgi:hypothetical protein